jgi:hypothetical protein
MLAGTSFLDESLASTSSGTPFEEWDQISGSLGRGFRLTASVQIHVWQEGEEYVAAAPDFDVHAFGKRRDEAVANLRQRLIDQTIRLSQMADRLGPGMKEIARLLEAHVVATHA